MKMPNHFPRRKATAFTLVEVMVSMSIVALVLGLSIGTFIFVTKSMYRDNERLATNASLRYFVQQVSQETLDSTEFYIFKTYQSLGTAINLDNDVTDYTTTSYGVDIYHGDCLVLVTRINQDITAAIRQFRIYYRVVTDSSKEGPIRYYESQDYGLTSNKTDLAALLNAVNLKANPTLTGSVVLAKRAMGRPKNDAKTDYYPIFSSEYPTISKTNENVAINVEIINGNSVNNMLSSSSFNYTISPRR